ncbi:hypothetical protein [Microbacterium aoyamense]|uniref:hypothetical protein n=1 Tax=Microbacterium aoyamense TaxID=344166 RepID=UPI002006267D|nr:hypothetical protein [Microbacterium aoyamense]
MTQPPPSDPTDAAVHPPIAATYPVASESGIVPISTDHEQVSPPERPAARSRSIVGWAVGLGVAALVIVGGAFVHVSANLAFDEALLVAEDAAVDAEAARDDMGAVVAAASAEGEASDAIAAAAGDDLVDPAARAAFVEAASVSATALQGAETALGAPIAQPVDDKPIWTWELFDAVPALESTTESLDDLTRALTVADAAIDAADADLDAAATALYASVAPAADALEVANVSARNAVVIDFRTASDTVTRQTAVDTAAADAFEGYAAQAAALKTSAAEVLQAKAGPLYDTRLAVEAYARSIAGGVLLEFDWAPYVNGVGGPYGISGTATWNTADGGFSTITLSDSVAETWPGASAKALVTHEVGHSITSKCHEMFDSADQAQNEAWATAWAISMGHTDDGNGVQAYGYPPQELIDKAATCR